MGESALLELVGSSTARALEALGEGETTSPKNLAEIAIRVFGESGLLLDHSRRNLIFERGFTDSQVHELAESLGRSEAPWSVCNLRPTRGSESESTIFGFFGLEPPEVESGDSELPDSPMRIEPEYRLFGYQRDMVSRIQVALSAEISKAIVHMPTGSGKTRTAMSFICRLLREKEDEPLVFWLADGQELCEQAAQEFERAWSHLGNRPLDVHRVYTSNYSWPEPLTDGVVIGGVQKLWALLRRDQTALTSIAPRVRLIVFDEAHHAAAETYETIISQLALSEEKILGLTATPGRGGSETEELVRLFYRKLKLRIEPFESCVRALIDKEVLCNPELIRVDGPDIPFEESELEALSEEGNIPPSVLKKLSKSEIRNTQIVVNLEHCIRQRERKRILLFCLSVQHAENMATLLAAKDLRARTITTSTGDERRETIELFKSEDPEELILCLYQVLSTGFDAPKADVAFIARPISNHALYWQMIGRVIRGPKMEGTETADVYTVMDPQIPGFQSIVDGFESWEDDWIHDD